MKKILLLVVAVTACEPRTEVADAEPSPVELHAVPGVGADGPTIATRAPHYPSVESRARSASAPASFGFGRPATTSEIARLDIDVGPDGAGLPPGSGTVAEGADVFLAKCAHCHGLNGEGGLNDRLVKSEDGQVGRTIGTYWPYATTLFDYTRRAMPYDQPGSMTDDEVYSVSAWLLFKNGLLPEDGVMDASTMVDIVMPGRSLFVADDRERYNVVR
ncbi:MAG: c-type cytochrome [Longimicrobiales bacterium]